MESRIGRKDEILNLRVDDREATGSLDEDVEAIASGSIKKAIVCWNCQKKGHLYKQCDIE